MNILFIETSINPSLGGVERATWNVSTWLKQHGYSCYYAYYIDSQHEVAEEYCLKYELSWKEDYFVDKMLSFIIEQNIDIVISQGIITWPVWALFKKLRKLGIKRIFCYHTAPTIITETKNNLFRFILRSICRHFPCHSFFQKLRGRFIYELGSAYSYRQLYDNVDCFVLLSESFKGEMMQKLHLSIGTKIQAIPNPLTFEHNLSDNSIYEKEKIVLIVARLSDYIKNISGALRIWNIIEKDETFKDWRLEIIGDGPDKSKLEQIATEMSLQRVSFLGHSNDVKKYYSRSSIFMMTSAYEGFGITLTEALQMGCVPIAYDTFSSLHDIIADGQNGFIIPAQEPQSFAVKLKLLMTDDFLRHKIAQNAIGSVARFDSKLIKALWTTLMDDMNYQFNKNSEATI